MIKSHSELLKEAYNLLVKEIEDKINDCEREINNINIERLKLLIHNETKPNPDPEKDEAEYSEKRDEVYKREVEIKKQIFNLKKQLETLTLNSYSYIGI